MSSAFYFSRHFLNVLKVSIFREICTKGKYPKGKCLENTSWTKSFEKAALLDHVL